MPSVVEPLVVELHRGGRIGRRQGRRQHRPLAFGRHRVGHRPDRHRRLRVVGADIGRRRPGGAASRYPLAAAVRRPRRRRAGRPRRTGPGYSAAAGAIGRAWPALTQVKHDRTRIGRDAGFPGPSSVAPPIRACLGKWGPGCARARRGFAAFRPRMAYCRPLCGRAGALGGARSCAADPPPRRSHERGQRSAAGDRSAPAHRRARDARRGWRARCRRRRAHLEAGAGRRPGGDPPPLRGRAANGRAAAARCTPISSIS